MQLDRGYKGFSFSKEGPLDMRMDPTASLTAEEIVNKWTEKQLGEIFRDYGEDPRWRQAARTIVEARRKKAIKTTTELAEILSQHGRRRLHPATLVFQALRICVNNELGALKDGLLKAIDRMAVGGRIGVISFHSLEDRIVKNVFRDAEELKVITKKPLVATREEIRKNPRSRSAKLRVAEKL